MKEQRFERVVEHDESPKISVVSLSAFGLGGIVVIFLINFLPDSKGFFWNFGFFAFVYWIFVFILAIVYYFSDRKVYWRKLK